MFIARNPPSAAASLSVRTNCPDKTPTFYDDQILAPTSTPHPLPVPKAPAFGKLATTAQIGPSGIVEKLEYNKAAALSDLLSSGAQIYNQTQPQSSTAQAAAVQGQADLIYQQQRLAACQLDHATCQQK
jgi:hypothetical protein